MNRHTLFSILIAVLVCSGNGQTDGSDQPPSAKPIDVGKATTTATKDGGHAAESTHKRTASESSPDDKTEDSASGAYVRFPAVGIKLRQPEGFEKADSFHGFGQRETMSSVMAMTLPGPFAKVTAGFTAKNIKARGWTFLSREDIKIDGLPAIVVHFEQPAGGTVFVKWSVAFGDEKQTTMVTATFPKTFEAALSARLKSVVLSTRPIQAPEFEPGSDLDFTLKASQKLKLTRGIVKSLLYTKDGVIPAKSPRDPLFIAAPALGNVSIPDKRKYAERRLRETAHTKIISVKSTGPITIDGLDGYETLAEAQDVKSGTPLVLYQVILFDEDSYILLQGLVGADLREEYLPEFKAMARSLRRHKNKVHN